MHAYRKEKNSTSRKKIGPIADETKKKARANFVELTPRHVLRDQKRARAGPGGQFPGALNRDFWGLDLNWIRFCLVGSF